MPRVTINYVYFASGTATTRQERHANGILGFTPIPGMDPLANNYESGYPFNWWGVTLPPTIPNSEGQIAYCFSFVSVTGAFETALTSFNIAQPPPFSVGTSPVTVLVIYLPCEGGGGNGSPGASIDAWDETTGALVNDFFVNVSSKADPGSDISQTESGNVYGWVSTENSTEEIAAFRHITETNADFDGWLDLQNPNLPREETFTANQGDSYYKLAFYKPTLIIPRKIPWKLFPGIIITDRFGNIIFQAPGDGLGPPIQVRDGNPDDSEDID